MGMAPRLPKEGLKRGAWTADEDKILMSYIGAHGEGKWRNIPRETGLKRCGKSCRLRWLNYLRPDIKRGNISPEEEDLIVRLHKLLGNRWSLIAGRLPGRTDNEIKNYWNTILKKKLEAWHKPWKDVVDTGSDKNNSPKTTIASPVKLPKVASITNLMAQPNPARLKSVSATLSPSLDPKNNDIYRVAEYKVTCTELLTKEDNGKKTGAIESPSRTGSEQENELASLPMDLEFLASDFSESELWKLLLLEGNDDAQGDRLLLTPEELMNNYWKN